MDEDERKSKLSAGKERLAAFQKKKKKTKKSSSSKKTDSASTSSSKSESTSQSFAAPPKTHSGNVSPLPLDDELLSTSLPATLHSTTHQSTSPVPFNVNLLDGSSRSPPPPPPAQPHSLPPPSTVQEHWALPASAVEQHLAEFDDDWALTDSQPETFSSSDLIPSEANSQLPSHVLPDNSTASGDGLDTINSDFNPLENHIGNPTGSSDEWGDPSYNSQASSIQAPPSTSWGSQTQQDHPSSTTNPNLNPQTTAVEIEDYAPTPPTTVSQVSPRSEVEQSTLSGASASRHSSPSPPTSFSAAEAQLQLRNESLQKSFDSLQNELKVANDLRVRVQNEMIALEERERALQEQLSERDQKHAAHIARITEQLSRQQESGLDPDEREAHNIKMIKDKMHEMHKMELEQVKGKHDSEKAKILQDCQTRLEKYRLDSEQQANTTIREMHAQFMSSNQTLLQQKTTAEELANQLSAKVNEMQSQTDSFHNDQASLKKHYETALESRSAEVLKLQQECKGLEKQLENWRLKSVDLEAKFEQEVSAWDQQNQENEEASQKMKLQFEEKIFQLTSQVEECKFKLQTTEMDRERAVEETRERFSKELDQIKSQHAAKIRALNGQLQAAEIAKQKAVEDMKKQFSEEMRGLQTQHASDVSLLEDSINESGSNKASLELAEQHMKSVQSQLDAYRTQERNFQSKISEMEQTHTKDMEQLQQQSDASKASEIGKLIEKYDAQIKELQGVIEASHSASVSHSREEVEALKAKHQKELSEVQATLNESHQLALSNLKKELELANFQQTEALHEEHSRELDALRSELKQSHQSEFEQSKKQLFREFQAIKDTELQQLEAKHKKAMKELQQSLSQSGSSAEGRLAALSSELESLKTEHSRTEQSQKDTLSQLELSQSQLQESEKKLADSKAEFTRLEGERHKYFTEGKAIAVDLSIERSAHEQDRQALAASQQEAVQLKAKCEYLQSEVSELEVAEKTSLEQSQKILELMDQLAKKNVALAELEVQNDALNTEIFALKQKCQQHVSAAEALRKQLESSWGANEELASVKQQLSEFTPLKEDYERMRNEVISLTSALKSKEGEVAALQTEFDQSTKEITKAGELSTKYQKAAESSALEVEALKQEVATLTQQEGDARRQAAELRARVGEMAPREAKHKQSIEQLNRIVQNLQSELQSSANHVAKLRQDKLKLEQDLLDSQGILDELATDNRDTEVQQNYDRLQQDFETLQSEKTQLAAELTELREEQKQALSEQQRSWQDQAREQEKIIHELQAQLTAKEEAFTEIQSEFGRQLSEAEQREKSLHDELQQTQKSQLQRGSIVGEKTALQTNLSNARQVLTEKLQEKATLENELSFHRSELERRLVEKQRLEELLFEKSRFEQELKNQKEQLKTELDTIESKLKLKELEVERERSDWQEVVQAKDTALHSQGAEFQRERDQLAHHHSSQLAQLSSDLNRQHDLRLSSLEQRHKKEVI